MPISKDAGQVSPPLVGTSENPARDPKAGAAKGRGTIGDKAFMDSVYIVIAAWILLLLLWYSLRNHNV